MNPLYKILGNKKDKQFSIDIKKWLLYLIIVVFIFTALIFFLINAIMIFSRVPNYLFDKTASFMKIYVVSCGLGIIANFLFTNSVINKNTKQMFVYMLSKSLLTVLLVLIFVPSFTFGLGVNGIAIVGLVTNLLSLVYLLIKLYENKDDNAAEKIDKKEYSKLMLFSFAETLIRNVAYYFIILVFLNIIDNQDIYFLSNEYIWSIMLVPTLAQNSLIKQELSDNNDLDMKPFFINTILITMFMFLMTLLSIVVYKYIYNLPNYMNYFYTTLALLPCYIIFIFDVVAESYFIETGKL